MIINKELNFSFGYDEERECYQVWVLVPDNGMLLIKESKEKEECELEYLLRVESEKTVVSDYIALQEQVLEMRNQNEKRKRKSDSNS